MSDVTVGDILDFLQEKAPFESAVEWDNSGLLAGSRAQPARRVLTALDITGDTVDAAVRLGAGLIVSHHPVIFRPLRRLDAGGIPYRLAREGIAAICAHTNLDRAGGGVNDTLAGLLGLREVRTAGDGLCRIGTLDAPADGGIFAATVGKTLHTAVRFRAGRRPVRTVCLCSGAGGDYLLPLLGEADAFLTGELRHHEWLEAAAAGVTVVEAGHYATEAPVVDTLVDWLSAAFPVLSCVPYYGGAPYTTL